MRRIFSFITATSLVIVLAACESSEDRAEKYYQSALALIAEGDNDRAIVELRNVFTLDGNHLEARHKIAELILNHQGNRQGAYSQYLRIVEQFPDDLEARIALARLAFQTGNWDELNRHGTQAVELSPEDPAVVIIKLIQDYRQAVVDEDEDTRKAVAAAAISASEAAPEDLLLRELLIDNYLRNAELSNALVQLDIATKQDPSQERFWSQRLQVLVQLGDEAAVEAQLLDLVERFPEDSERKALLVRYYMSRERLDDTETFLRKLVDEAPADDPSARIDLIRFLTELRGVDAAKQEIDRAIEVVTNPTPFIVLKAGLDFSTGQRSEAIAAIEGVLENAEPGEDTNNARITLARMLVSTGNEIGARSLVESVLAEDASHVNALKMNANWLIAGDNADAAISALRTALDKEPDDPEALSLMAQAYRRTGSTDLARDYLSLAVEASNNAPAETIRYVRVLVEEERYLPAEDVLLAAIRLDPQNVDLLSAAGELYILMNDMGRAQQVAETLRRIGTPQAMQVSIQIEAERLNRQSGAEEALGYLEEVANAADATVSSRVMLIRAQLAAGNQDGAVTMAEELLSETPDDPSAKLVVAATASTAGNLDRAEELYRDIVTDFPTEANIWLQLAQIKARQGDPDAAKSTIEEGLALNPDSPQLLWGAASNLERDGDIDGAIAIYERLYANDSSSIVVANNLASLLTTHRTDPESLERAWNIARRFRDSTIPAVQDTYGWITHKRGNSAEAVEYLQNAATGLPEDALVQFHLAEALNAVDRKEDALAQYRRVLEIAGATDTRPQIALARERLATLEVELQPQ